MPNRIKATTTKSLMPTMMLLSRADSLVPPISVAVSRRTINAAGRLTMPCHGRTVRQLELCPRRRGILRWNVDAEIMQQRDNIARPADGDGGGAHGVFEDEVPTDDPGEDLAQGRIGVGAAGDR